MSVGEIPPDRESWFQTPDVRCFVDTSVLVYAFDGADPARQSRACSVLEHLAGRGSGSISAQVLNEFYVTVVHKLEQPLAPDVAADVVRELARMPVVAIDEHLALGAIERARRHGWSHWDALIFEAARAAGCSVLLTEDLQDGFEADGVVVRNPFSRQTGPVRPPLP